MDIAALLPKYDRPVPRYTSYPTAPHFTPAVDGATYGEWLAALPDSASMSLYLHVPFCAALCLFCACHTTVARRPEPLESYAATLRAEIDLITARMGRPLTVHHLHWGGGTPTILPPATLKSVMDELRRRFTFAPDAEIAIEIDPRTLTEEMVDTLAEVGVNRVSLGVQDFNEQVQHAIGRHQSFETTSRCVDSLRRVGISGINLDLIYGLPHQTVDGVVDTVSQALELSPDRAAVFGYAHVPWMKKHQALLPEAALPGSVERFHQRAAVEETILGRGYVAAGLDHFALPQDPMGRAAGANALRRNFQGYTTDTAEVLVGLGASSIGSLPQGYVQNHPAVPSWRDAVREGRLPTARGIALTAEDRLRRAVIEAIMCHFAVDLAEIAAAHKADPSGLMDAAPALQAMARDGLVDWDGYRVAVTEAGRPFLRWVAAAFDSRLAASAARHSAAV